MIGNPSRQTMPTSRGVCLSLGCLVLALSVPLVWRIHAADSRVNPVTVTATKFQFARMRYGGGIPDYVKNWYTDYPSMDTHLTTLLRRMTGIDVAPPSVVEPASEAIFDYPLIYSVEPEQMVLAPRDAANLREYLARGGLWFADDFHGDQEFDEFLKQL